MSSARGVRFTVERVAEVDVGNTSSSNIQTSTTIRSRSVIPDIFDEYVNEIATMNDKSNVFVGDYNGQADLEHGLARISNPNLSQSAFRETAVDIAVELNDLMQSVNASLGTLFIAHVQFNGPNVQSGPVNSTVLLKMAPGQIQRLIRDNGQLDGMDEDEVYPETSDIQKAAIFPLFKTQTFRRSGDIKLYDQSESEYFSNFLQCNEVDSSLAQFKRLTEVVSELRQRDGKGRVNKGDIQQLEQNAQQNNEVIDRDLAVDYIDSITSKAVSQSSIRSELQNAGIHEIDTANASTPEKFNYVVDAQGDEIRVKLPLSLDGNVNVKQQSNGVLLKIEGNDVTKETTGK